MGREEGIWEGRAERVAVVRAGDDDQTDGSQVMFDVLFCFSNERSEAWWVGSWGLTLIE